MQLLVATALAGETHKAQCPFTGGMGIFGFVDEKGEFFELPPDDADSGEKSLVWTHFKGLATAKWGEPRMIMKCLPPRKQGEKFDAWDARSVPIVVPGNATKCIYDDAESSKASVYCD